MGSLFSDKSTTVSISMGTIIKVLIIVLILFFLWSIKDVLAIIIVAVILGSAMMPWVDALQRRNVSRLFSIILIYAIIFGVISLILILFAPIITKQVQQLAENLPAIYDKLAAGLQGQDQSFYDAIQSTLNSFNKILARISSGIFVGIAALFGGLFSLIGIFVLTFYILLEEDSFKKFIQAVSPSRFQPYLIQLVHRIQRRTSEWLKAQLILGAIIGALSFIGLSILGVNYALLLALIAGVTELVPIIGPILGAVPAVIIALTQHPLKGVLVVILYVVIQQLENHFIVPKIMQKVVGLNPIAVIIVMLIGAKIAGIIGIILAVPITLIGNAILEDYTREHRLKAEEGDIEKVKPQ